MMRTFLVHYEQCLSLATAADRTRISGRLPYVWKNRKDRTGRWFRLALRRAEHAGVQRIRAEGVGRALERSDVMLLAILKARDPWFMPQPKQVTHEHKHDVPPPNVNVSSTSIAFGHFTDEEMATFDRLLKKCGVPEHLLNLAPIDVDSQAVTEAQPSRRDDSRDP